MRAAVMRNKKLVVDDIATPAPGPGEALVKTLACGICGSDLHALKHAEKLVEGARRSGGPFIMDLARDVVMGHEFCAEVVDYGPKTQRRFKPGARVCAMPVLIRPTGAETVGYSNDHPGGYGEFMRLTEKLLLEVPNGLATERAALTEPLAVGYHAVARARMEKDDAPLVIGCGPVGLAVIAALKLKGVHPIVAADFSPRRRALAQEMGADVVVDPREKSPYESWRELAAYRDPARAPQLPPWMPGPVLRPAVIFECVGVPGVIEAIMAAAPAHARMVVVGVCMERDHIEPLFGINKELNLQFVLGYTGEEFADTLRNLAEGKVNGDPLVTGKVGVEGVAQAFEDLASPERHAKILVEPWRS
ncbi:MAG TPA: zinc-binding dehydrogenase [Candidatus Binataceae bacterium]|nr:zinc-binding dehydrogenase [Candidatus Binataceae bacterium]